MALLSPSQGQGLLDLGSLESSEIPAVILIKHKTNKQKQDLKTTGPGAHTEGPWLSGSIFSFYVVHRVKEDSRGPISFRLSANT